MSRQSHLVGLNVGGRIFVTSRDTLTRDPESMLACMLTEGLPAASQDKDGNLVIDRDGDTFKYILNFLRDGSCVYPLDFHTRAELLREANYFQVQYVLISNPAIIPGKSSATSLTHQAAADRRTIQAIA